MQMSFWTVILDFGLMSGLILIGQLLRAKIKFIQQLYLPASLIAGFIGLVFGPNGLKLIPFSTFFGSYSGVLIVLVFATLPIGQEKVDLKESKEGIGNMWGYSLLTYVGQYLFALLLGIIIFVPIFKTHPGFGYMLPAGFVGGHGTAAAVGTAFAGLGWDEATSLGMTSATVGILSGLIVGIILIKRATKRGDTNYIGDFESLPNSFRTGLLQDEERPVMGKEPFSTISVDPLAMHFALILFVSILAKYLANFILSINPKINLPIFTLAVIVGFILQAILNKTGGSKYVDKRVITRIGSTCTDYLVGFGVASIQLGIVVKYAIPLIILFALGIAYNIFMVLFLAPRMFKKCWFEKGIYTFGWASGVTAIGITLLRITDPEFKSKTLDDFSLGYLFGTMPAELILVSITPILINEGMTIQLISVLAALIIIILLISWKLKWFYSKQGKRSNKYVES
ncbi:MAG: sodium/glutamate symporter [Sedimentibacter sp.]|uniref:sodium/glutamate symporter n=1 Tax=Sedimentibacter sp. TaxID=1960295 RepID=UPI003158FBEF